MAPQRLKEISCCIVLIFKRVKLDLPTLSIDKSIQQFRGIVYTLCLSQLQYLIIFQANIENHDEAPHYASSHSGLDRLHMSHLWEVKLIVVLFF